MPSLKVFGLKWHTSTDALPLVGAVLVLFNFVLLTVFIVFMLLFSRLKSCVHSRAKAVVWGTLAFLVLSLFLAACMVVLGVRGTPLEPSKRRLMQPVMYAQSVKWLLLLGWLPFAIYAVYSSPAQCWSSARRTETIALLWSLVGVIIAIYVSALCTYNLLAKYRPDDRWQKRLTVLSKLLGCYKVLQTAEMNETNEGGSGPLQEIARSFARFFGQIDVEKLDVAAGIVLAELMQAQQRRARVAEALQQHGKPGCNKALIQQLLAEDGRLGEEGGEGGSRSSFEQITGYVEDHCSDLSERSQGRNGSSLPQQQDGSATEGGQQQGRSSMQQGRGSDQQWHPGPDRHVSLDMDGHLLRWMRDISRGRNFCLTPSSWGASLAPQLTPQQSAQIYTGPQGGNARKGGGQSASVKPEPEAGSSAEPVIQPKPSSPEPAGISDYVGGKDLREAQRWSKYAVAAYGSKGYTWTTPKTFTWTEMSYWRARAQLSGWLWLRPRRRVVARAKPLVQQKLRESKRYLRHYVGACKVAGATDDDFVYVSFTNVALGSTPYIILLDRPSRTVVLAIRGSSSYEDLITDLMDRPVDITDWVPEELKQELEGPIKAHAGMFSAAKAVLQDLNKHQILPLLLRGEPLSAEERDRQHAVHVADERDEAAPAWRRSRRSVQPPGAQAKQAGPGWGAGATLAGGRQDGKQAGRGAEAIGPAPATPAAASVGRRPGWGPWLGRISQPLWRGTVGGGLPSAAALSWWGRLSQPFLGVPAGREAAPPIFAGYAIVAGTPDATALHTAWQAAAAPPPPPEGRGAAEDGDRGRTSVPQAGPTAPSSIPARPPSAAGSRPSAAEAKAEGVAEGAAKGGASMEEELGPEDNQRLLQERGLDCRGWNLVVTGHSLGAAVAALVGMHFRSWCPGARVWAYNPPGGMVTKNLSAALRGFVTSVVVGKDIISRTGTVTFERMLDQMVVALARTRLSKLRILLQARSRSLRKYPSQAIFRPMDKIPLEALEYVRGYFESKCQFSHLFVPMYPPGRTMQLRRLKDVRGGESWDAVWIEAEQIMEEGILLSRHQNSDHYTARLTSALEQLVAHHKSA